VGKHSEEEVGRMAVEVLVKECKSLEEFKRFITEGQENYAFKGRTLSSKNGSSDFTGTRNFEEAMDLFEHGWRTEAEFLNKKLGAMKLDKRFKDIAKYDIVGYQASVPRYLQGIPTNMVNKKRIEMQNKIVTLTKNITYSARFGKEEIQEESLKVLHLVKTLEEAGKRVNLNVVFATGQRNQVAIIKVCIKRANERLNISKLAFPLVHASMLRRLFFRALEVIPGLTETGFVIGYGHIPDGERELKKRLGKDEYYIPSFMDDPEYYERMINGAPSEKVAPRK
jgi:hypothetical protein